MSENLLHKYQIQNEQYRIELASIAEKLNQHTRLIDECLSVRGVIEAFRTFMENQKQHTTVLYATTDRADQANGETSKRLKDLERMIEAMRFDHDLLQESCRGYIYNLTELTKKTDSLPYERQMAGLKKDHEYAFSELKKMIEKLRADLVVSPAQIISNNKELLQKIEAGQLDGSNAMSKVNNFELQIRVLEKKMESLGILLKKIDLNQQST